jgi:hypothetical protein
MNLKIMGNKIDQLCKFDISIKRHNYYYCTKFTLQIRITLERRFFHLAIKDQVYADPTITPTAWLTIQCTGQLALTVFLDSFIHPGLQ